MPPTGEGFTAKDFRTWGGTLRAIAPMSCTPLPQPVSEPTLTRSVVDAIQPVANELDNTPAVCRKFYINAVVFAAWREGAFERHFDVPMTRAPRKAERLALMFVAQARRAAYADKGGRFKRGR